MQIKVKYFNDDCKFGKIDKGDWIDVRVNKVEINGKEAPICNNKFRYFQGDVVRVYLGFAMELPKGHEARLLPRSTAFDKWNLIQTNSEGVIDNTFNGDDDEWNQQFLAFGCGELEVGDRIGQFKIVENQKDFTFTEVEKLGNENRGQGSTGKK